MNPVAVKKTDAKRNLKMVGASRSEPSPPKRLL